MMRLLRTRLDIFYAAELLITIINFFGCRLISSGGSIVPAQFTQVVVLRRICDSLPVLLITSPEFDSKRQVSNSPTSPLRKAGMGSPRDSYYVWDCSKKTVQQNPWTQPTQYWKSSQYSSVFSRSGQTSENSFGSQTFSPASSLSSGSLGSRKTVGSLLCLEGQGQVLQPKQSHWYSRGNIHLIQSPISSTHSDQSNSIQIQSVLTQ